MSHRWRRAGGLTVVLSGLPLLAAPAAGADEPADPAPCHTEAAPAAPAAAAPAAADLKLPDALLTDQDGRRVRFADLVAGRRVALNFIFTTCTTICPPMGAHFARLERLLAERGVSDVCHLSLSIDPQVDSPPRLLAWRQKLGGGSGWTLLTGPKREVDALLKALGVYTASPLDHAPLVLLSDGKGGRWQRAYGLTPPAELAALLLGEPAPAAAAGGGAGR
jgi:cytochrome oxidase Cu insertion factor (SCO1/SenC/PrrC family)